VASLAPDGGSVAAGRKLAAAALWSASGCDDSAVWGLAQGSGKNPYQAAVDLAGPAYKCSCPSRKIPCKHVLGLLLLWADGAVVEGRPPPFVEEWLASRSQRAQAAGQRSEQRAAKAADPQARAKRQARRSETIGAGLADLERFLDDLVRQGLAAARERPAGAWDAQARRLVDAQAPALADRVRRLGATLHAGREDWPVLALAQAASLHLAARAWQRGADLPADLREDLRAHVGWSRTAEEVRAGTGAQHGPWAVVAVHTGQEERLRVRRTWLLRVGDGRPALLLDFAAGAAGFATDHVLGTVLDGALHPHPGRSGLRMTPAGELRVAGAWDGPPASATVVAALDAWGAAIAADPFLERLAVAVADVVPVRRHGRWWVRAADGAALPLAGEEPWTLVALAGGRPVGVAGEWNGDALHALCAHAQGRVWALGRGHQERAA
jgi:hypothetical protein